ncbi:hypothetical protein ID866_9568 [Astraeus odoratus]|nr:hypothetical protein ID866_9568 [Astraeus odoratus]
MSSNNNFNNNSGSTSTPSIASDWMTIPDAQLNWDDNDMDKIAATKFQESNGHEEEVEESKEINCGGQQGGSRGLEARGSDVVAEAICELTRELTSQLDMLTNGVLKELQGQSDTLESLVKTQQNISWKMTQHYSVLEDMLGELEVFAANLGEPLEEEDTVEEEDLEEVRGELEGLGPIVDMEQEMEGEQQGENQDKGKGKERAE